MTSFKNKLHQIKVTEIMNQLSHYISAVYLGSKYWQVTKLGDWIELPMKLIYICGLIVLFDQQTFSQETNSPNVVLILADDLGWKDVSFNGSNYYETPNIDRLASQGVFFSNAYSNAPNCAPSRAALLSGQYGPRTGFYTNHSSVRGENSWRAVHPTENHHQLDHDKITIAETLKENGYNTIHIGKWHVGDTPDYYPETHGFDINIAGHKSGRPTTYFSPYNIPNLENGSKGEYLTDRLASEAINFIENNKEDPFFLYMAFYSPHTPIQAKDSLIQKYIPKLPDNGQIDPIYAAMVETLDYNVGRILQSIEQQGLSDNTIVIFFSDNGTTPPLAANKPLREYKGSMYEGGIRVPLIIKSPGCQGGFVNDTPVIGTDLYPTILDLLGVAPPKSYPLDGASLKPILEGNQSLNREAIYWHFPVYLDGEFGMNKIWRSTPIGAVRKGDFKLMEFFEDGHLELYDLKNDIGEQYNVVDQYPEKTKELKELMMNWRADLKVSYPLEPNPNYDPTTIPYNPKMGERSWIYTNKPKVKLKKK
jgi:arylsulfatase A-like enzyme